MEAHASVHLVIELIKNSHDQQILDDLAVAWRKEKKIAEQIGEELVKTFIAHTHIPLNTGGEEKWARALARLNKAGVEKVDIISALGECYQKGIVIANLGSIVNPAIICMARRKGRANKEEDYTRYLKGEYAEFLRN